MTTFPRPSLGLILMAGILGCNGAAPVPVPPEQDAFAATTAGEPRTIAWRDVTLEETAFWKSPRSGARYPGKWRLAVASLGLDVAVEPLLADQELVTEQSTGVTYWEGACRVRGTRGGRPAAGRAYAELTGYARRDVPGFPR